MILKEYAARSVIGRRQVRAVGCVQVAMLRNIFTAVAIQFGILLKLVENVRVALINGFGQVAFFVIIGHVTKIGMQKKNN
ncbi:MAG TPA: hypothetical protein PKY82_14240 [Pyrinomonadaceae bacterium]|nr:hypothetical protein [Pyrinomonadaceae bacterium]